MLQLTFDNNGSYELFIDVLNVLIGDKRDSFIDLGCCHATVTGRLTDFKRRKYVDIIDRLLDYPEEQQFFKKGDILDIGTYIEGNMRVGGVPKYTVSFANDVPEHLLFEDGLKLYSMMDRISDRQIMFTPDKEWMFTDESDKNPESHRSLWTPEILEELYPNKYGFIHFPDYHPQLNIGAFFFWSCKNISEDFERVTNELKTKTWAKDLLA